MATENLSAEAEAIELTTSQVAGLVQVIEERRRATLDLIYATPGLSLTAQAFLFSVTLNPGTAATGRIIGSCVGVVAGVATAISMLKHNYTEEMYGAILDRLSGKDGHVGLHRKKLAALALHTAAEHDFNRWKTSWWRRKAQRIPSTDLWIYSLFLFALIDVMVLALAIVDAATGGAIF